MSNKTQNIQGNDIQQGEIVLYQPDETVRLEVRLENDTVWLTQAQMAELFQTTRNNMTLHIGNVYKEKELEQGATSKESLLVRFEGKRQVTRKAKLYNLDVIISVGYRVKSQRGTQFRQWANRIIKDYLLRGYSINDRMMRIEQRVTAAEEKIEFFVRTSLPPVEGIFYDGQVFSARLFVEDLIKTAKHEVVLIDNYVDAKTFDLLDVRNAGVQAAVYTERVTSAIQQLVALHNQEHPNAPVFVHACAHPFHDRFLIIDDQLWHCGASFKDLGRKLFAIDKMAMSRDIILNQL